MKKAIVKKTGDILDVKSEYKIMKMEMSISFDIDESDISNVENKVWTKPFDKKEGCHYVLSDDQTYFEDDVIVGTDNIRDWKIDNLEL